MIYKWSWGVALILVGLSMVGVALPVLLTGVILIVAGIAFIAGI